MDINVSRSSTTEGCFNVKLPATLGIVSLFDIAI